MHVLKRLFAASIATAVAGVFLIAVPTPTPAAAAVGIHTMSVSSTSVAEGGLATVSVSLNTRPFLNETISGTVKTVDGSARSGNPVSDYVPKEQTVTFTCNNVNCPTSQSFTVQTLQDSSREPDETIRLVLSNLQRADKGSDGQVTINDNDAGAVPTFTISDPAQTAEGNADSTRTVTVSLSPASNQAVSLNYATANGSALSPSDYTSKSGTLTWPAGNNASQNISITIKGDAIGEPDESFVVNFSNPNNAALPDNQAVVQLNNDDGPAPVLTLGDTPPKAEGIAGSSEMIVTVNLDRPAPQTITVNYATSDGTAEKVKDYTEAQGTITFSTGISSRTVAVRILGDQVAEPDETFLVTLTNANNAVLGTPASREYTILNDDYGEITTAPGAGRDTNIRRFGPLGAPIGAFTAFGSDYKGGAHAARGDFFKADGTPGADGFDEVAVGPGRNSNGRVLIYATDGITVRANFFPFGTFTGGVVLAAGNIDGNSANGDELVAAAGPGGGPHVKILRVLGAGNFIELGGFMAYHTGFSGGVRVAVGDMVGDGRSEIIVAPGPGGGPHVKILSINSQFQPSSAGEFMAYGSGFAGGVFVGAAGGKLVTGAGAGGGPHVRIFSGAGTAEGGFFAYDPGFTGGVTVGAGNLDGAPTSPPEIVTGAGAGGGPHVKVFSLSGSMPFGGGFFAYEPTFSGGVGVGVGNG